MFTILTEYYDDGSKAAHLVYTDATKTHPEHKPVDIAINSTEIKENTAECKEA